MIVIKCKADMKPYERYGLDTHIREQVDTGTIILPPYCDLLYVGPDEKKIVIKYADGRVVPLTKESDCKTCKKMPGCNHNLGQHDMVRINCPLWRPK